LSDLELCPKCKKGYLKPTGEFAIGGEITEPFRETDSMRKVKCDNPECETNRTNYGRQMYESEVKIGETLTAQVIKAVDVEKMKNNPRLCTSCQKETEIVFRKDDVRLCKVCLDSFRDKYG
jgi:hypothetical protein